MIRSFVMGMFLMFAAYEVPPEIRFADEEPEAVPGDDEPAEQDFWEGIEFGEDDFAEVRRFVRLFYIDPSYDKRLAWIFAANFALREMTPPYELLPDEFYRRAKASAKLRKRFGGPVTRLRKADPFLLHEVGDRDKQERDLRSLSFQEIENAKKEMRARQEELERAFARIPFQEEDFRRVVTFIRAQMQARGRPISDTKIFTAAARGYLASLDPHSTILSARAWDESTQATSDSSFEGIGAVLTKKGDQTIIETPMEGQPAFEAGLRAGDMIIAVDGKNVEGMDLQKVVKRIRGPKGTPVRLTIRRLGEPKDLEFVIVRQRIEVKNIQTRLLERHPDVGWLKITGFVEGTADGVKRAVDALVEKTNGKRLRGLILDLRFNSGGLLQEAVEVADLFLDQGVIVSVKNPSERDEVYRASPGSYKFPVVVLVNSGSASAAEILASALQENRRALVVGERTFGKASVQTLLHPLLRRDYYIKLTIARYYAPSGRTIQVTGVSPDIEIPPPPGEEPRPAFREEDLMHHLSSLSDRVTAVQPERAQQVSSCERKSGMADSLIRADPNPQVKPDYALLKAADYLECLIAGGESDSADTAGVSRTE